MCAIPIVCASAENPPKEAQAERKTNFAGHGRDDMAKQMKTVCHLDRGTYQKPDGMERGKQPQDMRNAAVENGE